MSKSNKQEVKLSRLEEIKDLRKVWENEAGDFTPWLSEEENLALLSDAVGIDITVEERESSVGDFSVDIFAKETDTDRKIIIENQLEDTDHDHLGKLITYASGKGASIIIWVVKHAREEHKAAIEWLNSHTDDEVSFFLCEIKLYKIGDSNPAVKFEVVEQPNDWSKEAKKTKGITPAEQQHYDYWSAFVNYAYSDKCSNPEFSKEFKRPKIKYNSYVDFKAGSSLCHLSVNHVTTRNALDVELYIDNSKELFFMLKENKDDIEQNAGLKFEWKELENKQASRIIHTENVDLNNRDKWPQQFDWIMDTILKMKKAFRPYLN